MLFRVTAGALFFSLSISLAYGQGEVQDQSNIAVIQGNLFSGVRVTQGLPGGQVVTTGVEGKLSRVEFNLLVFGVAPLWVDIVSVIGEQPDFTEQGRKAARLVDLATVPFALPPAFNLSVDFLASDLYFRAGEKFGVVLRIDDFRGGLDWSASAQNLRQGNTYPGGSSYTIHPQTGAVYSLVVDAQFRTFVIPGVVPEPSAFSIAASSLLGLLASRRRALADTARPPAQKDVLQLVAD